jgi:hypothetical protein
MTRKTAELVQVKLRMPEYLRRQVVAAAKKSGRSISGEFSRLVEEGLEKPEREALAKGAAQAMLAKLGLIETEAAPAHDELIRKAARAAATEVAFETAMQLKELRGFISTEFRRLDAGSPPQ